MAASFVVVAFAVAGLINLLPVLGLLGAGQLGKLYQLGFEEPNLLVLMRHRALLFGLVGCFLLAAIWLPQWRLPAGCIGLISMGGFIALAAQHAPLNAALRRVVMADWFGLAVLLPALALLVFKPDL